MDQNRVISVMPNYNIPLNPDCVYHIFSRAIGKEKLFLEEEHYYFFLKRYKLHISPVADTFAYNLLPNHFHFLVRIKTLDEIKFHFLKIKKIKPFDIEKVPEFIMERLAIYSTAIQNHLIKEISGRVAFLWTQCAG